ncbi:hydrogenase/urease maturation nickel metallochaperone HypA [Pandoraea sputorum]|uniref:hydrogenase/urease maturation nickel metallochaperone HypA n=1 Tax=Pandoraea sputorum TaxID=93222 RepID=UPI00123EFCF9|nr:hydrogenase/urease maturation nickel metallochaperone HypA [Pandoraea sputorum]VVE58889.1 hydrogenase nickel incorporation protein HypA [Pandoraea sputorum]
MHETGIVRELVERIVLAARSAGARRIRGAQVWIGALAPFSPEHFREHFEKEARGTPVEATRLHIECSDDMLHDQAQYVMLQWLDLEFPDDSEGM